MVGAIKCKKEENTTKSRRRQGPRKRVISRPGARPYKLHEIYVSQPEGTNTFESQQ